jgi:hypothetical protein
LTLKQRIYLDHVFKCQIWGKTRFRTMIQRIGWLNMTRNSDWKLIKQESLRIWRNQRTVKICDWHWNCFEST